MTGSGACSRDCEHFCNRVELTLTWVFITLHVLLCACLVCSLECFIFTVLLRLLSTNAAHLSSQPRQNCNQSGLPLWLPKANKRAGGMDEREDSEPWSGNRRQVAAVGSS